MSSERRRGLFAAKVAAARAIGALSRRSGRGGGTTLPGRFLLRIAPDAIGRLGAGLERSRTIISATNGKTTTAGMLASALHAAGRDPVHNRAGSNMAWGVATALLDGGGDEGLFEVDEAWLPNVADELAPTLLVLGNLFRDQLDRYGELERLADQWAAVVAGREGRGLLSRRPELRHRPGLVDHVNGAVGKLVVAEMTRGQARRGLERGVGELHAVVFFVSPSQPAQDLDGLLG